MRRIRLWRYRGWYRWVQYSPVIMFSVYIHTRRLLERNLRTHELCSNVVCWYVQRLERRATRELPVGKNCQDYGGKEPKKMCRYGSRSSRVPTVLPHDVNSRRWWIGFLILSWVPLRIVWTLLNPLAGFSLRV